MKDFSMNSGDVQGTAANGSENAVNGDAVRRLAFVYAWDDPAFKENPTAKENFRLSVNIAHDLGVGGKLYADTIEQLTQLGAVRSVTAKGTESGRKQSNPDNPTGTTTRGQGWFMPPLVQRSEADETDDAGDALSDVQASVERGEDGQALEHEVGQFAGGAGGSVSFDLNFGDAVATVEPTTTPTETRKAEEFPEFGAVDLSRVVGAVRSLTPDSKPSYLLGHSPVIGAAVNRVHGLGCSETLVAAVSYAGMGLRSFPLVVGGKMPAVANGFKAATSDVSQLVNWFDGGEFFQRSLHHDKNLGIATGETDCDFDLVVLDVDMKGGKDGLIVLGGAAGDFGTLPVTLTAVTPSGGLHYVFKVPKGSGIGCTVDVFKQHGKGLDIRGHGGYIAASPSVVNGKRYQWVNDLLPVMLPDSWITALQAECPVGGKRGAVSGSGNSIQESNQEPLTDQQRADVHEVIHTFTTTVIAKNMKREDWLIVMAAAKNSGFDPEALRPWSELNADKDGFETTWNSNLEAHPLAILKAGFLEPFGITNPTTRRKAEQEAAAAAQREAARVDTFGVMPEHLLNSLHHQKVSMPASFVDEGVAVEWLNKLIADGEAAPEGSESQFIAGMLTMNADTVKAHAMKHPTTSNRSTVRGVIGYTDGSKPQAAGAIDWDRFAPDWVVGTSDAAIRVGVQVMFKRAGGVVGEEKITPEERALVHRVFKISPLGLWWRENAPDISTRYNGWNLKGTVDKYLDSAKVFKRPTVSRHSGNCAMKNVTRASWISVELPATTPVDANQLEEVCDSSQIGYLLAAHGCTAVFDEMRWKTAVHGLPKRFDKLDLLVTAIREIAGGYGQAWRKADVTDALKLLATGTRYHPALEWVRRIPWDGIDRFQELVDTVTVAEDYKAFWPVALWRVCMGAVRCLVQPGGMKGITALVFYDALGGSGKDMWQSRLCPEEFTTTPEGFKPTDLNWKLAALDGWFCILPEITTKSTKHSIEEAKAYLTASKHSYTDKYEMDVNHRPVRTVNIASTNQQDFLADRSGNNRRFAPVQVLHINYRHSIDMQQFWAQMLHTFETAWEQGDEETHQFWFTDHEATMQKAVNALHVVEDALEYDIKSEWDFDDEAWNADRHHKKWAIPLHVIKKTLDPLGHQDDGVKPQVFEIRLARELARLGANKVRVRETGAKHATSHYLMPPTKR